MGTIGNLTTMGNVYTNNAGLINNYSGNGSSVMENWGGINTSITTGTSYVGNAGSIQTHIGSDNTTMDNFGSVTNAFFSGNTTTNNFAQMDFVDMFAGNNNNSTINNFQGANIDLLNMNVNSSNNTGFLTANNGGNINSIWGHDHVDQPPAPPVSSDLITVNNFDTGSIGFGQFSTSGIGQVDINNWGAWNTLNASGNTNVWNF